MIHISEKIIGMMGLDSLTKKNLSFPEKTHTMVCVLLKIGINENIGLEFYRK
jgi:hypothetical protein